MELPSLDTIVSLAKRRGFIFPGSEIYGGLAGTFDYGPLGLALKKNIENLWWRMFVEERDDMYGIDAAILMNAKAWEASGHVAGFSDPLAVCKHCHSRYRIDHLVDSAAHKKYRDTVVNALASRIDDTKIKDSLQKAIRDQKLSQDAEDQIFGGMIREKYSELKMRTAEAMTTMLAEYDSYTGEMIQILLNAVAECPNCHHKEWSEPKQFNMMFKTHAGATEDENSVTYLRPETAGGMFVNFKNIVDSYHPKLPFGMAQIGKAFRNEIAPREFVFRLRELSQMEIEYFVRPAEWEQAFEEWRIIMHRFAEAIGLPVESLHELEVASEDRAHYSKRTIDFEFDYPFGRRELWGLAYRTDFDLSAHQEHSKVDLGYLDDSTGEKFVPHAIEPSFGVDRTTLAVLSSAYREDDLGGEKRVYLAFEPKIAPIKAMVSPLLKNKPELVEKAREVRALLRKVHPAIAWDDNGNIGKRYRRQDEIGTPFCITIDFDTLGETPELKDTVTLRHRDTGTQERLSIEEVGKRIQAAVS